MTDIHDADCSLAVLHTPETDASKIRTGGDEASLQRTCAGKDFGVVCSKVVERLAVVIPCFEGSVVCRVHLYKDDRQMELTRNSQLQCAQYRYIQFACLLSR